MARGDDISDALPGHPTTFFPLLFNIAIYTVVFLDPTLYWSNEIFLSLSSSNHTIIWFEEPWLSVVTQVQEIAPNCTEGPDLPSGKCIFVSVFYYLAAVILGALLLVSVAMPLGMIIRCIDRSVSDKTVRERIKLAILRCSNIYTFKEPSIAYPLRNLIDYIIIIGISFPQFRPSRFCLFALNILFTRLGQSFSIQSLKSLYPYICTILIDVAFLAIIYPLSYSHVVNSNSLCFAIEAYIKTRLLTKFCMYWFVRFVKSLPSSNEKFERKLLLFKSENSNLDDIIFFHYAFRDWHKSKQLRSRDRILLFDEVLVAIYIIILACIDPEFGNNMPILLAVFCTLLITVYFCRGVYGTCKYKESIIVKQCLTNATEYKYMLVTNLFGAFPCFVIFAVCISFNPRFNCFASMCAAYFLSLLFARFCQIIDHCRLPRLLIVVDFLGFVLSFATCFVLRMIFPGFDRFLFEKCYSPFIFLTLLSFVSQIAMGLAVMQVVYVTRIIYKCTKKLSRQYCFHFENQGYLLVKEFTWRDPEKKSNPGYQLEVGGFYDRNFLESLGCSCDDVIHVSNVSDLDQYGEQVREIVNDHLKVNVYCCNPVTETQQGQMTATMMKISEGNDDIRNHFDRLQKILSDGVNFANEESEHWITRTKDAQIINEDQLKKMENDYEATKSSLHEFHRMLTLFKQQALFLGHPNEYEPGQRIEALLSETQTKLEEVFNAIIIPARETLSSGLSSDDNSQQQDLEVVDLLKNLNA